MKKFRFLTLLGVIVITTTLTGCLKDNSGEIDAITYNDNLVDVASNCISSEKLIRNVYDNENSSIEDIENAINNTIKECTEAKKSINSLGNWEGDSSLKDGALNIIEKYVMYYTKFREILPYIAQNEVTEEEKASYESLLVEIESLDNELNKANEDLIKIQEQFSKNHGFELETNEEDTITINEDTDTTINSETDNSYEDIETANKETEETEETEITNDEETTDEELRNSDNKETDIDTTSENEIDE